MLILPGTFAWQQGDLQEKKCQQIGFNFFPPFVSLPASLPANAGEPHRKNKPICARLRKSKIVQRER